jgi:BASS family bile acid:Na+ symporter
MGALSGKQPDSSGEVSGVAKTSFFIENGKIKGAINETMISCNLLDMLKNIGKSILGIGCYAFLKLIVVPVATYAAFRCLLPEYALAALLLSGISSGAGCPFFAGLFSASFPIVFGMVVSTSLLVPFTLPALVQLLAGQHLQISFLAMSRLLCMVIFLPLALSEMLRHFAPSVTKSLARVQYPVSLAGFIAANVGVFSKYSSILQGSPETIVIALVAAIAIGAIGFLAGMLTSFRMPLAESLSVIICFGIVNNILMVVFSAEFFSHREPIVGAMYMVPFFGIVLPLRVYQGWRKRRDGGAA